MAKIIMFLFSFLFSIILVSCDTASQIHGAKCIEISKEGISSFEQHFTLQRIVPLETNDSCFVKDISRMIIQNGKIIILNDYVEVLIFDAYTGKFLSKINRVGNGISGYNRIMDITVDGEDDQIIIYSDNSQLLTFDFNGNLKESFSIGSDNLFENVLFDQGLLYFYNPMSVVAEKLISVYDLSTRKWINQLGIETIGFNIKLNGIPLVKSKAIWYVNPLHNYISKIEGGKISYPYSINTKNFIDQETIKLKDSPQEFFSKIDQENITYAYTSIKETSAFIYLKSNIHSLIWINKKADTANYIDLISDNRFGFVDLKYLPTDCDDDEVLFLLQPYNLKDVNKFRKQIVIDNNHSFTLTNFKEDSNPILLFYKDVVSKNSY